MNETVSTNGRIFAAAGLLVMVVGAFFLWFFDPVNAGFFPQCPFHAATGLNCPGCGMTRGLHALFHGEIFEALHFNLLMPFYVLFFGYLFISLGLTVFRGYGLSWKLFKPWAIYCFFAIALIFAVVRNLPFYPFNLLGI